MAKILAKSWKEHKSKKPMCLLSVEDRKRVREERKAKASENRQKAEIVLEKKREFFRNLKQKKEEKKQKKKLNKSNK